MCIRAEQGEACLFLSVEGDQGCAGKISLDVDLVDVVGIFDLAPSCRLEDGFEGDESGELFHSQVEVVIVVGVSQDGDAAEEGLADKGRLFEGSKVPGVEGVEVVEHGLLGVLCLGVADEAVLVAVEIREGDGFAVVGELKEKLLHALDDWSVALLLLLAQVAVAVLERREDEQGVCVEVAQKQRLHGGEIADFGFHLNVFRVLGLVKVDAP